MGRKPLTHSIFCLIRLDTVSACTVQSLNHLSCTLKIQETGDKHSRAGLASLAFANGQMIYPMIYSIGRRKTCTELFYSLTSLFNIGEKRVGQPVFRFSRENLHDSAFLLIAPYDRHKKAAQLETTDQSGFSYIYAKKATILASLNYKTILKTSKIRQS